jgi:hypothetical protein
VITKSFILAGLIEIWVVSGPGAGSIYWLPAGYADIGCWSAWKRQQRGR